MAFTPQVWYKNVKGLLSKERLSDSRELTKSRLSPVVNRPVCGLLRLKLNVPIHSFAHLLTMLVYLVNVILALV